MDKIKKYDNILILAGAGMGIDAGLPDYDGVHQMIDDAAERFNVPAYKLEHPDFYKENPEVAWGMKSRVMKLFLNSEPHKGYYKLKELLNKKNSFVVTSNIDDHFRTAGFNTTKLYEIHGRLKILQCVDRKCNLSHNLWSVENIPEEKDMLLIVKPPMCKYCGNYARPNVCFTDDNAFCNKLRNSQKANFNTWINSVSKKRNTKLLVIEIGCGRHKDAIGMKELPNGQFRIESKELNFPKNLTRENISVIRVNPDRNITKEIWEDVYYEKAIDFLN